MKFIKIYTSHILTRVTVPLSSEHLAWFRIHYTALIQTRAILGQ